MPRSPGPKSPEQRAAEAAIAREKLAGARHPPLPDHLTDEQSAIAHEILADVPPGAFNTTDIRSVARLAVLSLILRDAEAELTTDPDAAYLEKDNGSVGLSSLGLRLRDTRNEVARLQTALRLPAGRRLTAADWRDLEDANPTHQSKPQGSDAETAAASETAAGESPSERTENAGLSTSDYVFSDEELLGGFDNFGGH